jgi:dinuclear metal center YbgI/SA1388 family protein
MKKATIKNISDFLNKTLRVKKIHDASVNGLQVRSRTVGEITRVGFAVDACLSTFEKARKQGVELLVVHHGIKWRPQKDRVVAKRRTAFLKKSGMALYAVHLPLDLHAEYGNNVLLSRMLGLRQVRKFGNYHGISIGYAGALAKAIGPASVAAVLDRALKTRCTLYPFGSARIRTIGIVSGGAGSMVTDAAAKGLDCFLTGELDLAALNAAKDYGMNVIAAGHYATETVGVKALMPLVKKTFGVDAIFIDDPKSI